MTDPLDDAPLTAHERGFRRELIGLLLILGGLIGLGYLAATIDQRLLGAYLAVLAVVGGLWLGRGDERV